MLLDDEVDRPGVKLTEVQAIDGGYDAMAHGLQGGESWLFARERGVWRIAFFSSNA